MCLRKGRGCKGAVGWRMGVSFRPGFDSREETVLPNALTDRAYVLLRAGEIGERYGEIAGRIERKQYETAVSLITDAVWTAQDNPVLYLLRAFCWNQMEGIKMGLSRRDEGVVNNTFVKMLEALGYDIELHYVKREE